MLDSTVRDLIVDSEIYKNNDKNIVLHSLRSILCCFVELIEAKNNRDIINFYFTLSPYLPLYILNNYNDIDFLFFVDSDTYFFDSAQSIISELGEGNILLTKHYYLGDPNLQYGKFNVGLLLFKNSKESKKALTWWKDRCFEWCENIVFEGKYADQKYLDFFPSLFEGVVESKSRGINLGPWGLSSVNIESRESIPYVNSHKLIHFHFHRVHEYYPDHFVLGLEMYNVDSSEDLLKSIYFPYLIESTQDQTKNTSNCIVEIISNDKESYYKIIERKSFTSRLYHKLLNFSFF